MYVSGGDIAHVTTTYQQLSSQTSGSRRRNPLVHDCPSHMCVTLNFSRNSLNHTSLCFDLAAVFFHAANLCFATALSISFKKYTRILSFFFYLL